MDTKFGVLNGFENTEIYCVSYDSNNIDIQVYINIYICKLIMQVNSMAGLIVIQEKMTTQKKIVLPQNMYNLF